MTGEPNTQESFNLDRELLEMLMNKIQTMKINGQAWFKRKWPTDKRLYDEARKELNGFLRLLEKRGYSGERFNKKELTQKKMF